MFRQNEVIVVVVIDIRMLASSPARSLARSLASRQARVPSFSQCDERSRLRGWGQRRRRWRRRWWHRAHRPSRCRAGDPRNPERFMYCRTRVGRDSTIGRGLPLVVIDPPRFYEFTRFPSLPLFPSTSLFLPFSSPPLCLSPSPGKTADPPVRGASSVCVSVENFHDRSAVVCEQCR